jgi:hypothetical protein
LVTVITTLEKENNSHGFGDSKKVHQILPADTHNKKKEDNYLNIYA